MIQLLFRLLLTILTQLEFIKDFIPFSLEIILMTLTTMKIYPRIFIAIQNLWIF